MNYELELAIQNYLNSILYLSDRRMIVSEDTMYYLTQRVYGAFKKELGSLQIKLTVDENREVFLSVFEQEK